MIYEANGIKFGCATDKILPDPVNGKAMGPTHVASLILGQFEVTDIRYAAYVVYFLC
jgi:hypothetical protein